MDIYPLPLYMTPAKSGVKLYMLEEDETKGDRVVTVGMCVHNRADDSWFIKLRRRRREFLLKELGIRKAELYRYCIFESKLLIQLMESHSEKYQKAANSHPDGQVYMKTVKVNGKKERRAVMDQQGSTLILAENN